VKDHVAAVLRALKVSSRTQAVLAVSQMTQRAGAGAPGWKSSK
jgi:DNA-binding NarL/FixJ family response regulator